jgi:hypothetical protein
VNQPILLERTDEVQAKLASGAWIVEITWPKGSREMVERLVAVEDVKVPKKERESLKAMHDVYVALTGKPLTVAEVRKLYPKALGGDPYRDQNPIAPPHVYPAHIQGVTVDSPGLQREKWRERK